MYVTAAMVNEMIERWGKPEEVEFDFPMQKREYTLLFNSRDTGRLHDFTLYIHKGTSLAVIAKHAYPPGLYRAPSGGLHPGEPFEEGIAREAMEETGCRIALRRFLLMSRVSFQFDGQITPWTTYVLEASYVDGDLAFTDHDEIREARWAALAEFEEYGRLMRATDSGGLHYRAALHERLKPLLRTSLGPASS